MMKYYWFTVSAVVSGIYVEKILTNLFRLVSVL